MDKKKFNSSSKTINLNTKTNITDYKPVLRREINGILGKNKFNSLRILLYPGASSSIIIGEHEKEAKKTPSRPVGVNNEVTLALTIPVKYTLFNKLYASKIATWNFQVDYSQGKHICDMILGRDIYLRNKYRLMFLRK